MNGNICIKKKTVAIIGQINIHVHFLPRMFLCSGHSRSFIKVTKFTIKHIGTINIENSAVIQKRKSMVFARTIGPILVPMIIRSVEKRQYAQYIACITEVIFNAFNVFIISLLCLIIPHRLFNVKILQNGVSYIDSSRGVCLGRWCKNVHHRRPIVAYGAIANDVLALHLL